jgi:hypothetical protein
MKRPNLSRKDFSTVEMTGITEEIIPHKNDLSIQEIAEQFLYLIPIFFETNSILLFQALLNISPVLFKRMEQCFPLSITNS